MIKRAKAKKKEGGGSELNAVNETGQNDAQRKEQDDDDDEKHDDDDDDGKQVTARATIIVAAAVRSLFCIFVFVPRKVGQWCEPVQRTRSSSASSFFFSFSVFCSIRDRETLSVYKCSVFFFSLFLSFSFLSLSFSLLTFFFCSFSLIVAGPNVKSRLRPLLAANRKCKKKRNRI